MRLVGMINGSAKGCCLLGRPHHVDILRGCIAFEPKEEYIEFMKNNNIRVMLDNAADLKILENCRAYLKQRWVNDENGRRSVRREVFRVYLVVEFQEELGRCILAMKSECSIAVNLNIFILSAPSNQF